MPYARAENAELYYEEEGAGEPLILIMGLGGAHGGWFLQVPAFRKHFRVITYDARGLGLSRDSGESYTMRTLAGDVIAILDHLAIERSHVLGLSLGGMVAQEVAITYPERVRKLVLVATDSGGDREIAPAIRKAFGIDPDADLSAIELSDYAADGVDMKKVGAIIMRLSFNNPLWPWALSMLARRQGKPPLADDGTKRQTQASAEHNTLDRLHLIQAPTLVTAGSWDRMVLPHASEVLASRIPNATLKLLWGVSHALNFESFWRFNRTVLRFLKAG